MPLTKVLGYLLWLCAVTVSTPVLSGQQVAAGQPAYWPLNELAEILIDPEGQLTVDEAWKLYQDSTAAESRGFSPLNGEHFFRGYTRDIHWIAVPISSQQLIPSSTTPSRWYLELEYAYFNYLDIWIFQQGKPVQEWHTGSRRDFSTRPSPYPYFVIPLSIEPDSSQVVFIRLQTEGPTWLPGGLWQADRFHEHVRKRSAWYSVYYGLMLALMIYNLFLFFATRFRAYLYYTFYMMALLLFQLGINGTLAETLLKDHNRLDDLLSVTFVWLTLGTGLLFAAVFLDLRRHFPRLSLMVRALVAVCLLLAVISPLADTLVMLNMITVVNIGWMLLLLGMAIATYRKGQVSARFFILAWSVYLVFFFYYTMSFAGLFERNGFSANALMTGSGLEGLLLSLALADRINVMRQERKKLQDKALKAMEESGRLKDEFLEMVSHELRTPMNGVECALELLADELQDKPKARLYLESARASARDMVNLVDSLLDFSEVQSGTLSLQPCPFDLHQRVTDYSISVERLCRQKNLSFELDNHLGLGQRYYCDGERILLMISHLMDNAIKFTRQGKIVLSLAEEMTAQDDVVLRITVSDTGVGIPADVQQQIFQAFTQGESGFARQYGGLGIGLAICRQLVSVMKGRINFESVEGEGSSFRLMIPVRIVAGNEIHRDKSEPSRSQGRVLVVEDNPVNQFVMKGLLEKMGLAVLQAHDGLEAITCLERETVGLVFMDCQMPLMDGFETTRLIRKLDNSNAQVPVIAATANALSTDRQRCLDAGMNDYLAKPVTAEQLKRIVQAWLVTDTGD